MNSIRIGHSPDPDDAFMFYGFESKQVAIEGHEIEHVLHDIQTLNEMAKGDDPMEVTAMSLHAFLELEERFEFLEVGTSVGRNYGPRLVALEDHPLDWFEGKRIALPGPKTTATMVSRKLFPPFEEVHSDFTEIMGQVQRGEIDAGVIIHEGQLTYADEGLKLIADLGVLFAEKHGGLPLPLGVNCVRKDLPKPLKKEIAEAYRKSVEIAMTQRKDAVEYSLQYGRGLSHELADTFVGMYVNEDSLSFNPEMREAVAILRSEYYEAASEATV